MNENKSPTEQSTRPLGNTSYIKPTPLARGINVNAGAKLGDFSPGATAAVHDMIERKRRDGGGHAR
jgi:hypothetical protein